MKSKNDDDFDFDKAMKEVEKELASGKLYRQQLKAMKACGLDPNKPIVLTFTDGTTQTLIPKDSIKHLKPSK